jgi:hypothetical protein
MQAYPAPPLEVLAALGVGAAPERSRRHRTISAKHQGDAICYEQPRQPTGALPAFGSVAHTGGRRDKEPPTQPSRGAE